MTASALPYVELPSWRVELPLFGAHTLTIFGVTAAIGIVFGFRRMLAYARAHELDAVATDRLGIAVVVGGLAVAHWVSVLLYFPERVAENPWVLLPLGSGLSSVGGFLGGAIAFAVVTARRGLPRLRHADAITFGLLHGFTIGRVGCTLVHDHPGSVTNPHAFLAVGAWPDGAWRYDLGLLELVGLCVLVVLVLLLLRQRRLAPGRLTAIVAIAYGLGRFPLDLLRAEDERYAGLTPAQIACIGFVLAGIGLLRKGRNEAGLS
jgi:phosphatidylglycerol:prolipoprotein diacylglycerol transferase